MPGCLCILVPASNLYHTSSHTGYNNIKAYVFNLQVGLITSILILKKVHTFQLNDTHEEGHKPT